ncbi:MAG: tRNA lysidine(34) synthetase TilS [Calditrichaeota bacterium]|nr:MAG: tRNA lysidine(34) synthetase TilS [Calditrichota bacterium]
MNLQSDFNKICSQFLRQTTSCGIAVSGGIDSVVLLHLSQKFFITKPCVIHLNHSLRENADSDETFVKGLAEKFGLNFISKKIAVNDFAKKEKIGLEEAGRIVRYEFFEEIKRQEKLDFILTAHHLDDSNETFLLKFLLGSGFENLKGIPQKRNFYFRPLLEFQKQDLVDFAKKESLSFVQDETNEESVFFRNKVRNKILPLLQNEIPNFNSQKLNELSKNFGELNSYIDEKVQEDFERALVNISKERIELNRELFVCHFDQIIFKLIGICLSYLNGNSKVFLPNSEKKDVAHFLRNATSGSSKELSTDFSVFIDREKIEFIKNGKNFEEVSFKIGDTVNWNDFRISSEFVETADFFKKKKNVEFLSGDYLSNKLSVRSYRNGDSFQPLGMTNRKKLSDFFINLKVSVSQKKSIPLICSEKEIICIGNLRISEKVKVTNQTKKIVKIEIQK